MDTPPEVIEACLARCEPEQAPAVLAAIRAGEIIADILMTPPVWRERWWQLWRPQKPRG